VYTLFMVCSSLRDLGLLSDKYKEQAILLIIFTGHY
jgi:hypothetical protein